MSSNWPTRPHHQYVDMKPLTPAEQQAVKPVEWNAARACFEGFQTAVINWVPPMEWDDLPETLRAGWLAAARAARSSF
jgi:hypothetical protein